MPVLHTKTGRMWLPDALRGLALLNMLAYHAMYDWVYVFAHASSWYDIWSPGCHLWQQYICWSFILLSGFSLPLARRRLGRCRDLRAVFRLTAICTVVLAVLDCQMAGMLYRYQSDWLGPLLLAAALAWLLAERTLQRRGLPVLTKALRTVFPLAVLAGICYNFCVYFAAEPQLMGQNPALYENVSRLVQFWL